jgi:glycogen operon protein
VEGPTDDPAVRRLRAQQKRNFLATLFLSQGVPMLLAGDEMDHTQQGNNNAYCQDNELTWIDWDLDPEDRALLDFTRRLIHFNKAHPVFRRRSFFQGRRIRGTGIKDLVWLTPEGREMSDEEWNQSFARCLGLFLAGEGLDEVDERGRPVQDENFLLLLNAHHERIDFVLPAFREGARWWLELDTSREEGFARGEIFAGGNPYPLQGRSLALLTEIRLEAPPPASAQETEP